MLYRGTMEHPLSYMEKTTAATTATTTAMSIIPTTMGTTIAATEVPAGPVATAGACVHGEEDGWDGRRRDMTNSVCHTLRRSRVTNQDDGKA